MLCGNLPVANAFSRLDTMEDCEVDLKVTLEDLKESLFYTQPTGEYDGDSRIKSK